jgi:putative membrane protein
MDGTFDRWYQKKSEKGDDTMMGVHGPGFGGFGLIGMLMQLVVMIGLIVGVVLLVMWLWRRVGLASQTTRAPQQPVNLGPSAREVLQTRYVRGEITREQYQQMLTDIT